MDTVSAMATAMRICLMVDFRSQGVRKRPKPDRVGRL